MVDGKTGRNKKRSYLKEIIKTIGKLEFLDLIFNKKTYGLMKKSLELFGFSEVDLLYNDRFYKEAKRIGEKSAKEVVKILMKYYKPRSVADIGCGIGLYLKEFHRYDVEIFGVEGSKNAIKNSLVDRKYIKHHNLREPFKINKKFDVCLCIEVAEHIEKKYSEILIDALTNISDKIIFTAAPVGQGGRAHINEQPRKFWINLFKKNRFRYSKDNKKIKKIIDRNKNILKEIKLNLMIFEKII